MMIVVIYLLLFQISFVFTNQWTETSFFNFISTINDDLKIDKGIAESKIKQGRNRAWVPQSLTLLMNFKNDGTTSFQIMQGK
jgi:hypothetical protein